MRRFRFGGSGDSQDDQESGGGQDAAAFGPQPTGQPEQQPDAPTRTTGPAPGAHVSGADDQTRVGQEEQAPGVGPQTGDFVWPSSTPPSTEGQPETGGGEQQGQPVAAWTQVDEQPTDEHDVPAEATRVDQEAQTATDRGSRVSVIDEHDDQPNRPPPPPGASDEEYKWHTYVHYPSGRPDAVEFVDTYKSFGRNHILRGLNMGLPEGMVSMILGPSGTGKSVCIKHMVGLLYPDEGDIIVHGNSVPNMPDDDLFDMRKKFGLLFQDGALFGSMNVFDNVAFPLRQHTEKGEDEVSDIVTRRLNEVGLGAHGDKLPNELSGGMRKRAGFARALVLEPDIVLFDEPDSGLDPVRTALLGELILEIHRDMMDEAKEKQREHLPTFAVITHDIMSARRVADYINVLWKGRIVEAGPAEDMLNSENPFIRQFLAGESQGPLTMD